MRRDRGPALGALIAIILAYSLPLPSQAFGQASAAATPADPVAAAAYQRNMREAQRELTLGNWSEALAFFEQAHALKPSARTSRGLGMCLVELGRVVAASGHLWQALVDTRSPLSDAQREPTAQLLARANAAIARVQVKLSPSDAELSIAGAHVEIPASGELQLDPGAHDVTVRAPGYEPLSMQVQLSGGANDLQLALQPVASVPVARAEPVLAAPAPPLDISTKKSPRRRAKLGLIIAGATLAAGGLIGATTTGVMAVQDGKALHDKCPAGACPPSQAHALDEARQLALTSNVLWGVTALGAGLCLVGILLADGPGRADQSARLQLGPGSLTLRSQF